MKEDLWKFIYKTGKEQNSFPCRKVMTRGYGLAPSLLIRRPLCDIISHIK